MSTNAHTPGPWRIGDAGLTVYGPPSQTPGILPKTIASYSRRGHTATPEDKANARLIAQAPRMVELLQEFAYFPGRNEAEFYAIQEKARALLAKVDKA